MRTEDCMLSA